MVPWRRGHRVLPGVFRLPGVDMVPGVFRLPGVDMAPGVFRLPGVDMVPGVFRLLGVDMVVVCFIQPARTRLERIGSGFVS